MIQADGTMILTPAHCRAARGFLDWTQTDLAGRARVSRSTIRDYEGNRHDIHRATEAQLRLAFEDGGLVFIEAGALGWAVAMRDPAAPRISSQGEGARHPGDTL
jgi:transcriptional regulator with XRE-family HTH domain